MVAVAVSLGHWSFGHSFVIRISSFVIRPHRRRPWGGALFDIPPDIPLWWYFTALSLAALIIGIAKAGFGGGIAILAVPLTANALPAEVAVGVMLPILMVGDVISAYMHRGQWSWKHLGPLLIGAMVGIAIGTAVLVWFKAIDAPAAEAAQAASHVSSLTIALNIAVGGLCLLFVAAQMFRLFGGKLPHIPQGAAGGIGSGAMAGTVSTIAHSAGPVITIYLLEQKLSKASFVATMVMFFLILNVAKVPSYLALGLVNGRTLGQSAAFALLVPVGAAAGLWMHKRVAEKPFTVIMYLAAAAAGARMLYKGLEALG
jgi:hypothetical protein